jgi:hypothetical protein
MGRIGRPSRLQIKPCPAQSIRVQPSTTMSSSLPHKPDAPPLPPKPEPSLEPGETRSNASGSPPRDTKDVKRGSSVESSRGLARRMASPGPSSRHRDSDRDRPYRGPRHTDTYMSRRDDDRRDYHDRRPPPRPWEMDRDRDRFRGPYKHDWRRSPPPRRGGGR